MAKVFRTPIQGDVQNFGSASSYAGFSSASTASYSFYAGAQNTSGSTAQFSVTPAGTLVSNSASIAGVVTFTSGTLGPFTVSSSALSSSSGIFSASTGTFAGNLTASVGITTLGTASIISTSSATVPLTVITASGQTTGNVQEWKNSSGTILSYLRYDGLMSVGGSGLITSTIRPSSGTGGRINLSSNNPITIDTTSSVVIPLIVKSTASQTVDIQQWQNSSGSVLANITVSGGANFASASISGSVIATQAWVQAQGYSTGGISASTGTGSTVYNTSPTLLGTVSASNLTINGNLTASIGTTTLRTTNISKVSILNNNDAQVLTIESSSTVLAGSTGRDLYNYNTGTLLKINSTADSNTEAGEIEFIKSPTSGGYLEVNELIGSIKFNSQYASSVDNDAIGPSSYIKSTVKSLPSFQAPKAELEINSSSVKFTGDLLVIGSSTPTTISTTNGAANLTSASISGSAIATQAWVQAQGYGSGGGSSSSITASAGTVGGWNISSSSLYNQGSASSYVGMLSASTASYAFFAGGQNNSGSAAQFSVTPAGILNANTASISGSITFLIGTLGNWTVSSIGISGGNITSGSANFTAASVGNNRITTNDIIRGMNHVPTGSVETLSRIMVGGNITTTSSTAYYFFFTATETINASSVSIHTYNAVTLNPARLALYTVSNAELASASLTLVARSASTSVTTTAGGLTTRAFDTTGGYPATYTLTAGTRYAIGVYGVGATGAQILSLTGGTGVFAVVPIMSRLQASQSDLTLGISASSLSANTGYFWARLS